MPFNSPQFGIFLTAVFILYWAMRKSSLRLQNLFLLAASYLFYGSWDPRFLILIVAGSAVDYAVGLGIGRTDDARWRKMLLVASIVFNLGMLGFFKYWGFFTESFCALLSLWGVHASPHVPAVLLPVGISFWTFKKMSYTIDIYRRNIEPVSDVTAFFAFVAFFPQIMAGPIDRASTLLNQFLEKRAFSDPDARDGLRQMLSGFTKKLIIADNLAPMVDDILTGYQHYDGVTLVTGVFFLAMQIYCDFSGYSDIAIGCGRLLGFRQMQNFAFPYFSRDIAEFWRRWHISLSTWLRDYLYVPLCGVRPSRRKRASNIVITFVLCGLWHGASWTFVFWGLLHGLLFLPLTLRKRHPRYIGTPAAGRLLPTGRETAAILKTFTATSIAWVFFGSSTFRQAFGIIGRVFSHPYMDLGYSRYLPMLLAGVLLLVVEWLQREKKHFLQIGNLPVLLRWTVYCVCVLLIIVFGELGSTQFVYFRF